MQIRRMRRVIDTPEGSSTRANQAKATFKNAVCDEFSATTYGLFDCDFAFDSHEWLCPPARHERVKFLLYLPVAVVDAEGADTSS